MTQPDPIVEEIHLHREALLKQHQGSFDTYFESLLQAQRARPERYVDLRKRAPMQSPSKPNDRHQP